MSLKHCKSKLILDTSEHIDFIDTTLNLLKIYDLFTPNWLISKAGKVVCTYISAFCDLADFLVADENPLLNDQERIKVYFGHYPSGSSV
jgi:hypothetical protein